MSHLLKLRIDFDRHDPMSLRCHAGRQRPKAGTDFEDNVALIEQGSCVKHIQKIQIDQKILAVLGLRLQAKLFETTR